MPDAVMKWEHGVIRAIQARAESAPLAAAHQLLAYSQPLVPEDAADPNELRDSGVAQQTGPGEAVVAYGTTPHTAQYAVKQHEDLAYRHRFHGASKFLERPFREHARELALTMMTHVKGAWH